MKTLRILLMGLTLTAVGWAAAPDCFYTYHFTNRAGDNGTSPQQVIQLGNAAPDIKNATSGCTTWAISYSNEGLSALSIVLQDAPNTFSTPVFAPSTYVTFAGTTVIGSNPQTNTTAGIYAAYGYYPWVRANVTSFTGTGSVDVILSGWKSTSMLGSITINGTVCFLSGTCSTTNLVAASLPINDVICATGKDTTFFGTGVLGTVTVTPGTDTALPNSGTWTTTGGSGTGASGTYTAAAGNLVSVTITAGGGLANGFTNYASNPTWVPDSGALGTSTVAFSSCSNTSNGTSSNLFATNYVLGTLAANAVYRLDLDIAVWSPGSGTPSLQFGLTNGAAITSFGQTIGIGNSDTNMDGTIGYAITANSTGGSAVTDTSYTNFIAATGTNARQGTPQPQTWSGSKTITPYITWASSVAGTALQIKVIRVYKDR